MAFVFGLKPSLTSELFVNWLISGMYLVIPMFFMVVLSWAGLQAGAVFGAILNPMAAPASSAGAAAGGAVNSVATSVAKGLGGASLGGSVSGSGAVGASDVPLGTRLIGGK